MPDFHELKRTIGQYSATNWDDTLRRLADAFDDIQRRWPRRVDFSGLLPDSAIAVFPLLFVEGFGHVEPARLDRFLAGCKLLAGAITTADALFDEELERARRTSYLLCWQGVQFESMRAFGTTFPPDSPFWASLQGALAEYLSGIVKEASYSTRRRLLIDATHAECVAIATAKSCVARVAIVGLSLLGDDGSRAHSLLQSLDKYIFARQLWDDVQDWKADLRANRPTLITVRLATTFGLTDAALRETDIAAMSRDLYYGGHAEEFLGLARDSLACALDTADRARRLPWHALLERFHTAVEALRRDLNAIVERNLERRSAKASV